MAPATRHIRPTLGDLVLLGAGLVGLLVFISFFPSQHPDATASHALAQEDIEEAAAAYLLKHRYPVDGLAVTTVMRRNLDILQRLQDTLGRRAMVQVLADGQGQSLPAYYWRVRFSDESRADADDRLLYTVYLTQDGKVWMFGNLEVRREGRTPLRLVNREALALALTPMLVESPSPLGVLEAVPDSVLAKGLRFDYDLLRPDSLRPSSLRPPSPAPGQPPLAHMQGGRRIPLGPKAAIAMARHHLNNFTFSMPLVVDSTWVLGDAVGTVAQVRFTATEPALGQEAQVDVKVLASGGLQEAQVAFNGEEAEGSTLSIVADVMRAGAFALVIITLLIVFFRRLVARLIDPKTALVDAIILGLMVATVFALDRSFTFSDSDMTLGMRVLIGVFAISMTALVMSLFFFMISAVTDSLTRAVWSKKLLTVGLLRQGAFNNIYVGTALLRGVCLGGGFLGVVILALLANPQAGIVFGDEMEGGVQWGDEFLAEASLQPMITTSFAFGWSDYLMLAVILLGIGTFVFRLTQRAWPTVAAIALTTMVLQGSPLALTPVWYGWAVSGVVGLILGVVFWKYDFVTVFTGFFLSHMVIGLSEGWVVEGSPVILDVMLGALFILTVIVLGFVGVWSGRKGTEVDEYVPPYIKKLATEERLQRDVEIAQQVQASFLPRTMPQVEGLDLAGMCLPAYEVGGDYYDFVEIMPGRLAVVVGDVSGKGIQAAFYMTLTKGFLQSLCRQVDSPAEVLRRLNSLFYENTTPRTFISMIYGVIDVQARTFTFSRAGHNPVILKRSPSQKAELVQPAGIAIGLTTGPRFDETIEEQVLYLYPGDVLVFYTDGFSEAMDRHRALYGDARLLDKVSQSGQQSAASILRTLTEDVHHFIEGVGRHDDMTMVVAKLTATNHTPASQGAATP